MLALVMSCRLAVIHVNNIRSKLDGMTKLILCQNVSPLISFKRAEFIPECI